MIEKNTKEDLDDVSDIEVISVTRLIERED